MKILDETIAKIRELLRQQQIVLVAIDGYGGAGKTSLAKIIRAEFPESWSITLDEFATDAESGADRKRFLAHVLEPLFHRQGAKYQPFRWKERSLGEWIEIQPRGLILIEGVSVLGEDFNSYYDLRIWIDCPFELAQERMKEREEKAGQIFSLSKFFNVWEKEDSDYGRTEPWKRADIIFPVMQ